MKAFRSILYVAGSAIEHAAPLARALSLAEANQARLTLVDVAPPIGTGLRLPAGAPPADELAAAVAERRHRALEALAAPARQRVDVRVEVLNGSLFIEVIRAVVRAGHDLVIKPAENPDWVTRLCGTQDMHLLRKCPCPVWLTRPDEKPRYTRVVAAVDFDPQHPESVTQAMNTQILELAAGVALADLATLHVVHAWDAPEAEFVEVFADRPEAAGVSLTEGEYARRQHAMDRLRAGLVERLGAEAFGYLEPNFHLPQGPARTEIPAAVRRIGADLVVMGTVARTGIPGFLIGNTAEAILDQLDCAVLAIKPAGFVSPVTVPGD